MASDKRPPLTMLCTECKVYIYVTNKNKTNTPDRIELNKYCPSCRKHCLFKEKR